MNDIQTPDIKTHHPDGDKEHLISTWLSLLSKPLLLLPAQKVEDNKKYTPQELADEKQILSNFLSGSFGKPTKRTVKRYQFINNEVKDMMDVFRASEALTEQEKSKRMIVFSMPHSR